MTKQTYTLIFSLLLCLAAGADTFDSLVGPVTVGNSPASGRIRIPYITWGGDIATFYANGGLTTTKDSIFGKLGLDIELFPGDDFIGQVKEYLAGKTPALRGTFQMIGMCSETIGANQKTKTHVVMQLTWSTGGDNLVVRPGIKNLNDLKGKKFVLQKEGPHVGMLDDVLESAGLTWDDIKVVWVDNLGSGPGIKDNTYPASKFRNDPSIDGAFVISPDVTGLTGGVENTGSGAEGTVKGARVLMSTKQLSRSIADVYGFRDDFYKSNFSFVEKFVAGYLMACEELVKLMKIYEKSGSPEYTAILKMAQKIYGEDWFPTLDDVHGLISDCSFVGHPGNVVFFTEKNNLNGFDAFHEKSLNLALKLGYARTKSGFFPSGLDYDSKIFKENLSTIKTAAELTNREKFNAEAVEKQVLALNEGTLDENTLLTFTINFEPNQTEFSEAAYSQDFQKAITQASKFAGAIMTVRGHSDPTLTLLNVINAGLKKGIIQKTGSSGNYTYYLNGKVLDLSQTKNLIDSIMSGAFDGVPESNPRDTMQAAVNLSRQRAESVIKALEKFAEKKGLAIDKSQITPIGVGIREPIIPKPKDKGEAQVNMRVEFRLVKVSSEVTKDTDFDF
ncbi:MAG: ABC transporter substrate-binding protein [Candidatus Wallbacteria bacterium]|nr:ABC transporter substrate-binding protein [Candidatus Wallbacteria bacterium]